MPLQFQLEKKYADAVDILCFYENTLEDIYSKAGKINVPESAVQAMPSGSPEVLQSAPDQDYMKDVCVPFGGDQLTRVRFTWA